MSVTGADAAFFPLRGNYSSCVAWRQQGPQAQLVCNTTQVAVNPLAPTPTFPPASPHQWRDRNQTNRNLLKVFLVWNGEQRLQPCFHSFFVTVARMRRRDLGLCYHRAAWLGLKHEGLKKKWPLTCLSSFLVVFSFWKTSGELILLLKISLIPSF